MCVLAGSLGRTCFRNIPSQGHLGDSVVRHLAIDLLI